MWKLPSYLGNEPCISGRPERSRNQEWTQRLRNIRIIYVTPWYFSSFQHLLIVTVTAVILAALATAMDNLHSLSLFIWPVLSLVLSWKLPPPPQCLMMATPANRLHGGGRVEVGRDIMWPKKWLHCVPWPSCAAQLCWRTCGLDLHWDHSHWSLLPFQVPQKDCPCVSVPCGCSLGWTHPGSQRHRRDHEGEGACRRWQSHKARRSPALEMLHCCLRSTKGSGSEGVMTQSQALKMNV